LKNAARKKLFRYRQLYADLPDPIFFMPVAVNTSGRLCEDFLWRLLFLHAHREASALAGEFKESDQFRFLRVVCLANLKGSVDLILAKASPMRVTIPLD
jgi:hypothetical protein